MNSSLFSGILSLLVLLTVAVAEILWSKRYRDAKKAEIEALRAEIEGLKEMTPNKVREYFISTKDMLGQHIDELKADLDKVNHERARQEVLVQALQSEGALRDAELRAAQAEVTRRDGEIAALKSSIANLDLRAGLLAEVSQMWLSYSEASRKAITRAAHMRRDYKKPTEDEPKALGSVHMPRPPYGPPAKDADATPPASRAGSATEPQQGRDAEDAHTG
jgi:hypothetical protein